MRFSKKKAKKDSLNQLEKWRFIIVRSKLNIDFITHNFLTNYAYLLISGYGK